MVGKRAAAVKASSRDREPRAAMMAAAEMPAAEAVAAEMAAPEMAAAVTAATAPAECRAGQNGRQNQNGNSNAGLRHSALAALGLTTHTHHVKEMTREGTESSLPSDDAERGLARDVSAIACARSTMRCRPPKRSDRCSAARPVAS